MAKTIEKDSKYSGETSADSVRNEDWEFDRGSRRGTEFESLGFLTPIFQRLKEIFLLPLPPLGRAVR